MATNPAASMPDAEQGARGDRAPARSSSSPTSRRAPTRPRSPHVLLPALAWGEKDGTVTNSERRISRQRAFLPAPGEAMADWRSSAEVAKRMGFAAAFAYEEPHDIFAEYAALSALRNNGARDLDLGAYAGVDAGAYAAMAPFSWPARAGEKPQARRFFADGRFYHPDGRARFVATPYRAPASARSDSLPLLLNTGRIRDQWHTMTRTGKTARLMAHVGEPFVELHPSDAEAAGIARGRPRDADQRARPRDVARRRHAARAPGRSVRADPLDRHARRRRWDRRAGGPGGGPDLGPAGVEDHAHPRGAVSGVAGTPSRYRRKP